MWRQRFDRMEWTLSGQLMKTCWVGGGGVSVSDNQIREAKVDARGLSTLTEAVE